MKQTELPSLTNTLDGFEFKKQEVSPSVDVNHKALEIGCIDLISKLENLLAKSQAMANDDFIDESASIGRKMIESLVSYNNEFLSGAALIQAKEETDRTMTFADTYEEVRKSRPLANALIRAFWNVKENKDILAAHFDLGEALVRACATTFYHSVMMIGLNHDFGKDIDQSTVVFINELKSFWNQA